MGSIRHRPPPSPRGITRQGSAAALSACGTAAEGPCPDNTVALLTSCDRQGRLHSRPVPLVDVDDQGQLWFLCTAGAPGADLLGEDGRVNLAFSDPEDQVHVSISGHAMLSHDSTRQAALLRLAAMRLGTALGQPVDATALCVVPEAIEYWDGRVAGGDRTPLISASLDTHPAITSPAPRRRARAPGAMR